MHKHIIFDFDGVLVESNEIRLNGYFSLFKNCPQNRVNELIKFIKNNSGLSRYEIIEYFFYNILKNPIDQKTVIALAKQYSNLVKKKVVKANLVNGALEFLSAYQSNYDFAIVSGSDQKELINICKIRKINHFFVDILGSPSNKETNISKLLLKREWKKEASLYVGDSINDFQAANICEIKFIARNSGFIDWRKINGVVVINDLSELYLYL